MSTSSNIKEKPKKALPYFCFGETNSEWYLSRDGHILYSWKKLQWPMNEAELVAQAFVAMEEKRLFVDQLPYFCAVPVKR